MKFKFLNKIIFLLLLAFLFTPILSNAIIISPGANLTIVVNTEKSDTSFNFNLQECPNTICNTSVQFNLQTQNLTASTTTFINAFAGETFNLDESAVPGLKVDNILCTSDNPGNTFLYQQNAVSFSPSAWSNITCIFNNKKVSDKTPILLVPGIMGTEMKSGSELLWADINRMLLTKGDEFMDPLAFNKDLAPSDSSVSITDVIKSKVGFDYTEGLINEFKNQGYVEGETLFTFPYDWRYGVSGKFADGKTNVDLLKEKIESIIVQTGAEKINVMAHSNGGLLTKKYIMDNVSTHKIDKVIFVGVPNTGAPAAVKALLQGDNFGIKIKSIGFLNEEEMKKISQNMPVAYDLLPSQAYYEHADSFVQTMQMPDISSPNYSISDVAVVKDLNYSEFINYLTGKGLNSTALGNSVALHTASFDDFDMRTAGVNVFAIDGCKTATMNQVVEVTDSNIFGHSNTYYRNFKFGAGDGTVPFTSATNLPINQENKFYALVSDHGKMPSQDGIRQKIVNILAGSNLEILKNPWDEDLITQDENQCQLNGKTISVFSPVNILVIDQNGNKLGNNEDGRIINEIPGADFQVWGEHKFLFLPTDHGQGYNIILTGTGNGTFTIKTQDTFLGTDGKIENFINIPVTTELVGQINLSTSSDEPTTLTIKQNLETEEQTIYPSATLIAEQMNDFLPPVSTVTLGGEKNESNVYTTNVNVKIESQDLVTQGLEYQTSGVLNLSYNLDDAGFKKNDGNVIDSTVLTEGKHKIIYFAVDKNGNNEIEKSIEFEIKFPKEPEVITLPEAILVRPEPIVVGGSFGGVNMQQPTQAVNQNTPEIKPEILPLPQIVKPEVSKPKTIQSVNDIPKPEVVILEDKQDIPLVALPAVAPKSPAKINPFVASFSIAGKWFGNLLFKLFFWK